ncbi:MAG: BRO-N domain protein [Dasosvirus sp.]|uniref:BRO-N domain protein n=1 Tax=Dasosvirus sp. TaxID=2487764 RepID=A0A3G4ZVN1_9VIRU|nr:MAG: BRO-N domain protein [Dasosvirus sp.]
MSSLVDVYDGILKYNNKDIVIVIDKYSNIWFYGKQIADILEYKNSRLTIIQKVREYNKTTYGEIKEYSKYKYNIQDHAIFINESGLYQLILRSKMRNAIKFQDWIVGEVIPTIRNFGKYEMNEIIKKDMEKLNRH